MAGVALTKMTASEVIACAAEQGEPGRFELVAGEIIATAPDRLVHALVKARVWRAGIASGASFVMPAIR